MEVNCRHLGCIPVQERGFRADARVNALLATFCTKARSGGGESAFLQGIVCGLVGSMPARSRPKPCSTRSRPPAFTPVKLRGRKDGWSAEVQCAFLAALYKTGSVAAAAKAVGRSRASAYKLRERRGAESFARSWDKVLAGPSKGGLSAVSPSENPRQVADWRKLTHEELVWRFEQGLWRPVIYRGAMRAIARKPDNSALLRLLARLQGGRSGAAYDRAKGRDLNFLKPPLRCVKNGAEASQIKEESTPSPQQSRR